MLRKTKMRFQLILHRKGNRKIKCVDNKRRKVDMISYRPDMSTGM